MKPAGPRLPTKLVCLAGFMGCGKTTVGRLLAQQLGWRFVDLDERIEQQAGLRIAEIFERLGEPAFRKLENAELGRALGEAAGATVPAVLALGGAILLTAPAPASSKSAQHRNHIFLNIAILVSRSTREIPST